jgi:hypothetical protein
MTALKYWDGTKWVVLGGAAPFIEVYSQPTQPTTTTVGAIWIDTDEPMPSVAVAGKPVNPYTVASGYTADRAFNPEATSITEVARVLGTLIDDLRTAGLLQ